MLSKSITKLIKSLQIKKYRYKENLFLVEGTKMVLESLNSSLKIEMILATNEFLEEHAANLPNNVQIIEVKSEELSRISDIKTNNDVLAVVQIPTTNLKFETQDLSLVLDDIRDPGNLGTIVRLADWYGIKQIVASTESVDLYNPKTIRASMGSFLRVNYLRYDLVEFFSSHSQLEVYGALLEGENVHQTNWQKPAVLLIGNESNGINNELLPFVKHQITIPKYGEAESLNAAMATAILCDNFVRQLEK